jgi:hypothetical protein
MSTSRARERLCRKDSSPPTRSPVPTLGKPEEILYSRRQLSPARSAGSDSRKQAPFSPTYPTGPSPGPTKHAPSPIEGFHRAVAPKLANDRFVHRSYVCGAVDCDAQAEDCIGRMISASLRIAGSPAVSRLYLFWSAPWIPGMQEPAVIAAHGHSILFRVDVPFYDPHQHRTLLLPHRLLRLPGPRLEEFAATAQPPPSLQRRCAHSAR